MSSNDELIQDDKIKGIILCNERCEFYIPDKSTNFSGIFNKNFTELSGELVFPDGSRHDLNVERKSDEAKLDISFGEEFITIKEKSFSVKELNEDLFFVISKLREYHPQLYAFLTDESLNSIFTSLVDKIGCDLTLIDFHLLTSRLTDAVRCSHTGVRISENHQVSIRKFGHFFPLKLFFANGRAYYISGAEQIDPDLQPGSEVIRINDRPVKDIIAQVFYLIPAEGKAITTKYYELNHNFNTLYYYIDDSDEFMVQFLSGTSKINISLPSIKHSELSLNADLDMDYGPVIFNYLADKTIGMLEIPSFEIRDMEDYFQRLDQIFCALKMNRTHSLVIDLRGNKGGHPIFAAQLLSYLINHDFTYLKSIEDVLEFEPLYRPMQPNNNKFDGDIYVFVNGGCLSTTGHLISLLKFHTNAVFIGEEPGSTFYCNDFSLQFTLPNSGIELNVPRITFETSVSGFSINEPFPIEYKVNLTAKEIIDGKDVYLEAVRKIIQNKKL